MQRLLALFTVLIAASIASAGPVLNGDFETNDFSYWNTAVSPTSGTYTPPAPEVIASSQSNGIVGYSGNTYDSYAALDTTLAVGNPIGTDIWTSISQGVTINGITGMLEFKLTDFGDEPPPTIDNNHSGMLLDNIQTVMVNGEERLSFNWYALTKTDQQRNDVFNVLFNGESIWSFDYADSLLPTHDANGGGGTDFGPFSYGTGWQSASIGTPVPEPGTWALVLLGTAGILRRRRR